ncbi:MAG TPA: alpha/beta hydrolase-fold protein [Baekduia sp.]|uniref:alpha/beta hydrolase n=1 Tax=Baekduia sp. TaxID=2600305 RepID=UPI002C940B9F|nr:alpha/beta hydrolase-fold protein [Baekduia sp.]HMJ36718.1 alpha/beta hydrolase-fold protein [Baekduia sp.]
MPRRIIAVALVAAVAAAGIAYRFWPGDVHTGSSAAHGAKIIRYDVASRYVHRTLPQTAATPAGGGNGRPLLVFLHGRGANGHESNANGAFFAALAGLGDRAPDVVFPDGAFGSYWHRRGSGDWTRYVLDEVIPQALRRLKADPRRVAIGGISMGGFGAFDVARQRPKRFCAVGGHSAAVWLRGADTAPGAFDDAADFARHDVVALARVRGRAAWGRARLWLDGGTADPFRPGGEALATALRIPMHHWSGGHDGGYWRAHYARYLRFYADALAAC